MIRHSRSAWLAMCVPALLAAAWWLGFAHGQKTSTAQGRTVRLENERVRVVEYVLEPGIPMGMHNHPRDRVEINLSGSRVRVTQAGGKTFESEEKEEAITFSKGSAEMHDVVNIGNRPLRAIQVELK